ncbi:MAG: hypothetical protein ACJ73D_04475 [Pyrinomonadaceae bacterium]
MLRVILAAILGGVVMFAWGAFSHMVLNLEGSMIHQIPNEAAVVAAMKDNINEDGVYALPGVDMTRQPTPEEMNAWSAKYEAGPTAMLFYHTRGTDVFTPHQFFVQFGADFLAALFGSVILFLAAVSWGRGVIISALIGLGGWCALEIPYWDWYRFQWEFIRADLIDQVAAWFLAGLVMAFILRVRRIA